MPVGSLVAGIDPARCGASWCVVVVVVMIARGLEEEVSAIDAGVVRGFPFHAHMGSKGSFSTFWNLGAVTCASESRDYGTYPVREDNIG